MADEKATRVELERVRFNYTLLLGACLAVSEYPVVDSAQEATGTVEIPTVMILTLRDMTRRAIRAEPSIDADYFLGPEGA